jgi:hypothetical protein
MRKGDTGSCRKGDDGVSVTLRKGDAGSSRMEDDIGDIAECPICKGDNMGTWLGCCREDNGKFGLGRTASSGFEDEDTTGYRPRHKTGPERGYLCSNWG